MPTKKANTKEVIQSLNQGAKDNSPIINSPSGMLEEKPEMTITEVDNESIPTAPTSVEILRQIQQIQFLRDRIMKDADKISGMLTDLSRVVSAAEQGDYYLQEGLDSLKTGVEILKDHEGSLNKK